MFKNVIGVKINHVYENFQPKGAPNLKMAVGFSKATHSILRQKFDEKCKFFPCKMTKPLSAGVEIS